MRTALKEQASTIQEIQGKQFMNNILVSGDADRFGAAGCDDNSHALRAVKQMSQEHPQLIKGVVEYVVHVIQNEHATTLGKLGNCALHFIVFFVLSQISRPRSRC